MKRIIIFSLSLLIISALFISCNNEESITPGGSNFSELRISTDLNPLIKSVKNTAVSEFSEGSKLGLFITKGDLTEDYSSSASRNVLSALTDGIWKQTPLVNLYAQDAVIYAYYPYYSGNTNAASLLIQSGLTDYMYGTHTPGQEAINKDNPTVNLTMNHVCALLQFNFYKTNYPWEGNLTMINVRNAPGKAVVYYNGRLNIQTGEINDLSGTDRNIVVNSSSLMIIPETKSTDEKDFKKLFVLPTQQTTSAGEVLFYFTIDGKEYTWEVPAGTQWKQGTKNTYDVQLNGNELRIGDVRIADWTDGINGDIIIE